SLLRSNCPHTRYRSVPARPSPISVDEADDAPPGMRRSSGLRHRRTGDASFGCEYPEGARGIRMSIVYTIGYEATDIDRLVATLKAVGVRRLADVRAVALSRKKGFSKK